MMQEVSRSIQVSVYLLPDDVVGNLLMVSMAMHAKGTLGISKCSWGVMCSVRKVNQSKLYSC